MLQLLYYQAPSLYGFYIESADGHWVCQQQSAALTDLSINADQPVVVLIPSQCVTVHTLELPKMQRNQLIKAVPFALEEHLAEPVEQLHFVIHEVSKTQQIVWVIAKTLMEDIIDDLTAQDIQPAAFIPDCLALPYKVDHWTVYQQQNRYIVRQGLSRGFSIEQPFFKPLIQQQLKSHLDTIHCDLYAAEHIDLSDITQLASAFHAAPEMPLDHESLLHPPLNLLQAPYRAKRIKRARALNYWWIAAGAGLGFLAITLLIKITLYIMVEHRTNEVSQQALADFQRIFPNATALVEPQTQIEQLVAQGKANAQKNAFLDRLIIVGRSMANNPNLQLLDLKYQGNAMSVDLTANTLSAIEQVSKALQQQGLSVSQNQVKPGLHTVSAQLTITGAPQ